MDLQQYIDSKKKPKKVSTDIEQRWKERILDTGFVNLGSGCFAAYERAGWANNIGAKKLLDLAWCAALNGYSEVANSFFRKAAEMEGIQLSDAGNARVELHITIAEQAVHKATVQLEGHPGFPEDRQPGRFSPMQPEDAAHDREFYINHPRYFGQRKSDGQKLIEFVTLDQVFNQSREGNLNGGLDPQTEEIFKRVARARGSFVLEGERTFLDANGKEWMTGAEAMKSNQYIGEPGRLPIMEYNVFLCNWSAYTVLPTYYDMVLLGTSIAETCQAFGSRVVKPLWTATTRQEKQDLVRRNQNECREGEIWFIPDAPYCLGKPTDDSLVRTKYLKEIVVRVTGYTAASNTNYGFGSLTIESLEGEQLGQVGTGFTIEQRRELRQMLDNSGPFLAEVRYQSKTADQQLRHARFLKVTF
jgi:hypothetical protein